MSLETCDKHDDCVVVRQSTKNYQQCPVCEIEKVVDKLTDSIRQLVEGKP
jgi:hypothetical protein